MPLKYRADIDGLRAVAVLAVIFFHAGVPGFSGGFVGVDVFFLISGFLITSIILKEIHARQFSIARFYERRIRRIFPALFPVIAFTLVVEAYLFDANAFKDFGQSITATTLFYSNILFWHESGYFAAPSIQKPLLHTWSLAVEEQFYIFFPLALVFINKYLKSRYLLWILIAITLSLGASVLGVCYFPQPTFYLVPTRAWELLAGSILALEILPNLSTPLQRNILSITGLILIIFSIGFYSDATLFPGHNAIPPVLGTWLIIYSSRGKGTAIVNKFLSLRPLVFIGTISYSFYLWHWPFVAFAKCLNFRPFQWYDSLIIIISSLAVSILSWKYIEQPFRGKYALLPERKMLFFIAFAVMIFASGIGVIIYWQNGMDWRYPKINAEIKEMTKSEKSFYDWKKSDKLIEGLNDGSTPIVIGSNNGRPVFALWGDSHADVFINEFAKKGIEYGLSGYILSHTDRLPLLGLNQRNGFLSKGAFNKEDNNRSVISFIRAHPEIKTVIMAGYWSKNDPALPELKAGLFNSVKALLALGLDVVIVSDVPTLYVSPAQFIFTMKRLNMDPAFNKITPTAYQYADQNKVALKAFHELTAFKGVTVIHPESLLFRNDKELMVMFNNKLLYGDTNHLSSYGAKYVIPVFNDTFKKMATRISNQ